MDVMFGSARISEKGTINGKKGDQTGREVCEEPYYLHPKGWRVYRAKDKRQRPMLADAMKSACRNNHFGYGQSDNWTGFTEAGEHGYNPADVDVDVNIDCSYLVRLCCWYAGIHCDYFSTWAEGDVLMATGAFDDVTDKCDLVTGEGLYTGDILFTPTKGHTGIITQGEVEPEDVIYPPALGDNETAVYRMYTQGSGEHLFTVSNEEANFLNSHGWIYEGIAWIAPKEAPEAVYRLVSDNGLHMYTNDKGGELHALIECGWSFEGIAFHSDGTTEIFRLYNPNAGTHIFTTSEEEMDLLVSLGWKYEGSNFKALRKGA